MLRKTSVALGATFALVGSMIALPNAALAAPNDPVNIPDDALRTAVTDTLNSTGHPVTGELKESDLAALQWLVLEDTGVADLTGLEFATGLGSLNLNGTQVTDISALRGLTALTSLDASNAAISETSFRDVAPSLNLEALEVSGTGLGNAAMELTNPYRLNLAGTGVDNVSALADNDRLSNLDLSDNPISDISPLRGHTLENFTAINTQLYDLRGVEVTYGDISVVDNREVGYNAPFEFGVWAPTAGDTPVPFTATGDYDYDEATGMLTLRTEGVQTVTWNWSSGGTVQFSGETSFLVGATGAPGLTLTSSPRQDAAVVSWERPAGVEISGYEVSVLNPDRSFYASQELPANATSVTVDSPSNTRPFYVTVNYVTEAGGRSPVAEVEARSFATPPAAPEVSAVLNADGSAALVSVNAEDFTIPSFRVNVAFDADNGGTQVATVDSSDPITVPLDQSGNARQFTITVANGDASGAFGAASAPIVVNPAAEYVGPATADSVAPLNVRFEHTAQGLFAVWDANAVDDRYRVSIMNGSSFQAVYTDDTRQLFADQADASVVVAARSVSGEWVSSEPVEYVPATLTQVENLDAAVASGDVTLTWDHVSGANVYDITAVDDLGESHTFTSVTNEFSVALDEFEDASQVRWTVRGRESADADAEVGDWSETLVVGSDGRTSEVSYVILDPVSSIEGEYDADSNTVRFTWAADVDADRFNVAIDGENYRVSDAEYVVTAPAPGETLSIAVTQRGFAQTFSLPTTFDFTVPEDEEPEVPAPADLDAVATGDDVRVTWDTTAGALQYVLTVDDMDAFSRFSVYLPADATSYTLPDLAGRTVLLTLVAEGEGQTVLDTQSGIYIPGEGLVPVEAAPTAATIVDVSEDKDAGEVTVTWASSDIDVAYVSVWNEDGSIQLRTFVGPNARMYTFDRADLPAGDYTFSVGVRNAASPYAFSNTVDLTLAAVDDGSTPGGGDDNGGTPGDNDGNGGTPGDNTPGTGGGAGQATDGDSDTDVIKQTGASDLPTFIGLGFLLMGAVLMGTALIRRKKPVTAKV